MDGVFRRQQTEDALINTELRDMIFKRLCVSIGEVNVNLACGADYIDGWINIDGDRNVKADRYAEMDNEDVSIPLATGSVDVIYASHFYEHVWHLPQLKRELARVVKPGGFSVYVVPQAQSPDAWGDDTHCRAFTICSFGDTFWPGFKEHNIMPMNVQHKNSKHIGDFLWLAGAHVRL